MSLIPPFSTRRNPYNDPYSYDVYDPFKEYNNLGSTTLRTPPMYPPHQHNSISSLFSNVGVEWRDTPEAHVYKANLPGFKKEDVLVHVEDGNVLKITGETNIEAEQKHDHNGYYQVHRRSKSQFMNQFVLPQNARADQLRSSMDNGVLIVTIPKRDVNGPHQHHHQHVRSIDLK
ncbi:chaperone [Lithospermum erythrorhizon]|uniref:Chaperone n=1 Tax=Lithospermum erythrorhizon TaxID=34254 RepID=A0AAV3RNY5_LITER